MRAARSRDRQTAGMTGGRLSAESRKMHYIGLRHGLDRVSSSAPSRQATKDHKRIKSLLAQQVRHASARHFTPASAVQVHLLVVGEYFNFGAEIVWFNSNRAWNADSSRTVIAMTAHIAQHYLSRAFGLQLRHQRRYLYSWYNAIGAVLPVQRNAMTDKRNHCNNDYNLDRMSCCAKPTDDLRDEIAEDESDRAIRERVDAGAQEIKSQRLKEGHFHASS